MSARPLSSYRPQHDPACASHVCTCGYRHKGKYCATSGNHEFHHFDPPECSCGLTAAIERDKRLTWSLRQCDIMARRQIAKSVTEADWVPAAWEHVRRFCSLAGVNSESGPLRIDDDLQVGDIVYSEGVYKTED